MSGYLRSGSTGSETTGRALLYCRQALVCPLTH